MIRLRYGIKGLSDRRPTSTGKRRLVNVRATFYWCAPLVLLLVGVAALVPRIELAADRLPGRPLAAVRFVVPLLAALTLVAGVGASMVPLRAEPYGPGRNLVLTTTLQPCLQCAAAIRLGPIAAVRFAGHDVYWDGCHDFGRLSPREARRVQPAREGPHHDELGVFARLMSRIGAGQRPRYEELMRALGEGPGFDLAHRLADDGEVERLTAMEVDEALAYLWPRLSELREAS